MTLYGFLKRVAFAFFSLLLAGCGDERDIIEPEAQKSVNRCTLDKGYYRPGESVQARCRITAPGATLLLRNLSERDASLQFVQHVQTGSGTYGWTLSDSLTEAAYGLFLKPEGAGDTEESASYQTFYRIVGDKALMAYDIAKSSYRGLPVLTLDGGLSAEYAVAKAGANLSGAFSHSWYVSAPGYGPNPVVATPDFLKLSLRKTVDFYNDLVGENSAFDTVIIATGFPAVPYISRALGAPVLPLHFLAGADSVKEIQGILNQGNQQGYSAYSALGHDTSFSMAVAWIKLLDLPGEYVDFIRKHKVRNVIVMGSTGVHGGETKSRKVLASSSGRYRPGSIYLLYPGTAANDEDRFDEEIADFHRTELGEFEYISDWESGVIPQQIQNFSAVLTADTEASLISVTAENLGRLYDLSTHITAAFMNKNRASYAGRENAVRGVAMNPYLMAYPLYESYMGYIPYVYWQGNPPQDIASGMARVVNDALRIYFPAYSLQDSQVWLNSTRNFGGFFVPEIKASLQRSGLKNLRENDYGIDENWLPDSPDKSFSVQLVDDFLNNISPAELREWNRGLVPLSVQEAIRVIDNIPGIKVESH